MEPESKKHDVIITSHARERWIERIVDPKRYEHLQTCTRPKVNCETCISLIHDIRGILRIGRRGIDGRIASCYRDAKENGRVLKDVHFIQAIKKRYGEDLAEDMIFLVSHSGAAILVLSQKEDEEVPILKTVLSATMIEGTIFRNLEGDDLQGVFNRWKHERRKKQ